MMDLWLQIDPDWPHPRVVAPWGWNSRASRPTFSSSVANYLTPMHCSSFDTCNCSRQPQVFVLGRLSAMIPMCPSLEKGTCATVHHSSAWRHMDQLEPSSANNISFWAATPRVGRWAWCRDAPTWLLSQRPTHTHWLSSALSRQMPYPMSEPFPHFPRPLPRIGQSTVIAWLCMPLRTAWPLRQKSSNPHMALVDVFHRPTSVERSKKLFMLSLSAMEGKEPAS